MKDNLQFFIPMKNPPTVTHQQKQVNVQLTIKHKKPIFYEPERLQEARALLMNKFAEHVPEKMYENVPLHCTVKWFFPSKDKRKKDGEWKRTNPDTHNLNKLLFDVMSDLGYWKDDALVASETIQKFWVTESLPGIFVRIEVLE